MSIVAAVCNLTLLTGALQGVAHAATITVTGGDTVTVDDQVTLHEAINSANDNANVCADVVAVRSNGDDTITFAISEAHKVGGVWTVNLTGALPNLTQSITITYPSLLTVRRDTGGDYRIFTVPGAGH